MNVYQQLNQMIDYIEQNLTEEISYEKLAQILCVNENTMKTLFTYLCKMPITEYIRSRKLSLSAYDLLSGNEKIIDVAMKYGYDNATSFSRAFTAFHGVKPSVVRKGSGKIKNFPRIEFDIQEIEHNPMEYNIIQKDAITLFGKCVKTDLIHIKVDAPRFIKEIQKLYGKCNYGMVKYTNRGGSTACEYWVLWEKKAEGLDKFSLPQSRWLCLGVDSTNEKEIQTMTKRFYTEFLPSNHFQLNDQLPDLEHYTNGKAEILFPINN